MVQKRKEAEQNLDKCINTEIILKERRQIEMYI
jgi:hypothetical protein